ncbi:MAG: hypothetical protein HQM05_15330 [Magnetococcales bacterium]|nr:hypothetical protein [Magnetococcales bacterium]
MNIRKHHDGDCTIYSSMINGAPWDGICTCGYGLSVLREGKGDHSQLLSQERIASLPQASESEEIEKEKAMQVFLNVYKDNAHEKD